MLRIIPPNQIVSPMEIIGPDVRREADCEAVLRSLPNWFGIESALQGYAKDSSTRPTFALLDGARVLAFLTLQQHFAESWEVHCIAVHAEARNRGFGTRLLQHAEKWLVVRDARFLQVKTIAPSSPSASYQETREFYVRRGFAPLEVFPTLWHVKNPALQYIKVLHAG